MMAMATLLSVCWMSAGAAADVARLTAAETFAGVP
eukprot:SAG31_NODE_23112_length_511_cov_0.725728_1_plen_34_part_01